ncbi:hypothetical protein [Rickettsia endosymbiont of Orchestes rusci]|uniref:hypothetical protein n=1 Tax=Rickettsia endosymbiont of Orchestes rusci TaxID=3066250 RepID=UPI00313D96D9
MLKQVQHDKDWIAALDYVPPRKALLRGSIKAAVCHSRAGGNLEKTLKINKII